jgi:hypothetical protein
MCYLFDTNFTLKGTVHSRSSYKRLNGRKIWGNYEECYVSTDVSEERRFKQDLHGAKSQKTEFFASMHVSPKLPYRSSQQVRPYYKEQSMETV